ncbi:MAG: uracil-DNA glycosylase [Actinomycetota bacterium]|nr:uracil-DNA glycosylase [Actinomycetota bacterium]
MAFPSPVPAGTGWTGDPATSDTEVAREPADVARLAREPTLSLLDARTSVCTACPRLVGWRERVAREKRAAFAGEPYWGRPIAGWGDPAPRVLIVGLAPAAHGGNRTGRIFTGDRSGDWLFASLHRVGLAARATSRHAGDGQRLVGTRMVATVRCAPPDNRPTIAERDTCAPWLVAELRHVLPSVRVIVALGSYGFDAVLRSVRALDGRVPRPRPVFGHGCEAALVAADGHDVLLLGCFHPSQQNTFTGRLSEPMLDAVLGRAAAHR